MGVLFLRKNGNIEFSDVQGTEQFTYPEPVFVLWHDLESFPDLNDFEKVFNSLENWKFEVQEHMFSLKPAFNSSPEIIYEVEISPNPIEILVESLETISLVWRPETPPVLPSVFLKVIDEEIADFASEFEIRGKSEGRTEVQLIDSKTSEVLASAEVIVYR